MGFRLKKTTAALGLALVVFGVSAESCSGNTSTTSAQCGVVVGDGSSDHGRDIKRFIYPGQIVDDNTGEQAQYFPCGPRNYLVTDGTVPDANGHKVGDRQSPITAWTKGTVNGDNGLPATRVNVQLSAFWTPNQDPTAERDFYVLCNKYQCYTTDATAAGSVAYSTPGWNGMLGENFGPAVQTAVTIALAGGKVSNAAGQDQTLTGYDSDVVKNTQNWPTVARDISSAFMDQVRSAIGTQNDIFCGSGTSYWPDRNKPGVGQFKCSQVRFRIDKIEKTDAAARAIDDQTAEIASERAQLNQQKQLNTDKTTLANERYGKYAGWFNGLQDAQQRCIDHPDKLQCVFDFSGRAPAQLPSGG
jgi:hypothetical protein